MEKVYIIGIGDDGIAGLTSQAQSIISQVELLIGSPSALTNARKLTPAIQIHVVDDFEPVISAIEGNPSKKIALLASGDPLFYGTTKLLCDRFGNERFEILPHVSIMQLAFARIKESWDEAYFTDLNSRPIESVLDRIRTAAKVGLFTGSKATPANVAETLLANGLDYFHGFVCENLGSPYERVTQAPLSDLAKQEFSNLNVMILVRKPGAPDQPISRPFRLFGNPDELFLQSKPKRGLLTPSEIRAIALAEMNLTAGSVVWDVGAGCGSLAIEAAQIAHQGSVHAIEMDIDDYQLIKQNAARFAVTNLNPVLGQAPEAWGNLPRPNAIFMGGTGRFVIDLAESAFPQLLPGGRLVCHVSSIENLHFLRQFLVKSAGDANVWMLSFARDHSRLESLSFAAVNPSFLITAQAAQ